MTFITRLLLSSMIKTFSIRAFSRELFYTNSRFKTLGGNGHHVRKTLYLRRLKYYVHRSVLHTLKSVVMFTERGSFKQSSLWSDKVNMPRLSCLITKTQRANKRLLLVRVTICNDHWSRKKNLWLLGSSVGGWINIIWQQQSKQDAS